MLYYKHNLSDNADNKNKIENIKVCLKRSLRERLVIEQAIVDRSEINADERMEINSVTQPERIYNQKTISEDYKIFINEVLVNNKVIDREASF